MEEALGDTSIPIDQKRPRRMAEHGVVFGALLEVDAVRVCHAPNLVDGAAKPDEVRVHRTQVFGQALRRVPLRVYGDEQEGYGAAVRGTEGYGAAVRGTEGYGAAVRGTRFG